MSFEKSSPHSVMAVVAQHSVKQWSEFVESSLRPVDMYQEGIRLLALGHRHYYLFASHDQ